MIRRALITGAGGFVGGHLAAGLMARGVAVTALDRAFDAPARARLAGARLVTADLRAGLPPLGGQDVILHAAALTTDPAAAGLDPAAHLAVNMQLLEAALELAAGLRPRLFVFLSSGGVFAAGDGAPDFTDERVPTGLTPYALAKRQGEALVPAALPPGTGALVLRLGNICGPGEIPRPSRQRVSRLQGWIDAARTGEIALATPAARRDWTWAPDLAPALLRLAAAAAAEGEGGRPLHLTSGHILRDEALAGEVARQTRARVICRPDGSAARPPLVASDLEALAGFGWTPPAAMVAGLLCAEVRA